MSHNNQEIQGPENFGGEEEAEMSVVVFSSKVEANGPVHRSVVTFL